MSPQDEDKELAAVDEESSSEPMNAPAEPEGAEVELERLRAESDKKDLRISELEEKVKKLYADFDNFRKRKEAEASEAKKYAAERIISEFLPVMDNFERAVAASEKTENYRALKEGLDMVSKQIRDMLEKEGLKAIEALGKPFDPGIHQAVKTESSDDFDDEAVMMELLKGYKLHDRLIRPSMVIVNRKNK